MSPEQDYSDLTSLTFIWEVLGSDTDRFSTIFIVFVAFLSLSKETIGETLKYTSTAYFFITPGSSFTATPAYLI